MSPGELQALDGWLEERWRVRPPAARNDTPDFTVSVVIPSHRQRPIGLEAFRAQQGVCEVLVLQNGPLSIAEEGFVQVPWRGHGRTRQEAVARTQGDYVLFSVDDALPRGDGSVWELVDALRQGGFDAVTGRQLPWPHSDRCTQDRLARWTPVGQGPKTWPQVDNVFALYPRSLLLEAPFPDVPIAEDLHWSQGRHIGYVPSALVVHAHKRTPSTLYERTRALHVEHCRLGEPPRVPSLPSLLRALPGALKSGLDYGPKEIPNQLAELWGQYRGARMLRTQPKP